MAAERASGDRRARWASAAEVAGLALLSYVPFLLSSAGKVTADSKQYLYLDVAEFLQRAPHLWDEHLGAGTVSHQHIGYLFPMGPWFWLFERLGVEVWVAQRLWLGTVTLAAGLGARWLLRHLGLGRLGALAGAVVYLLTPYQLAFTARASVLVLPWAALPWLIGLADRAVRRGGWRDPAWFALVVLLVSSVNASSLILAGLGPLAWVAASAVHGSEALRRAAAAAARIGALSLGVSLWWIAALRLEAAYGLPVLHVTERLETVAATSSPLDVLRGLGNWFFYGSDRLGFSIDQAEHYLAHRGTRLFSFAIPILGLAAAVAVRWPHRARFVLLLVLGTVVSVGAWPLEDPSPLASAVGTFTGETSAGLALRNTARAAPLVVLGLAGLIGAAVSAWRPGGLQVAAASLVAVVAVGALWPVWEMGWLSAGLERDPVPAYWHEAAEALDEDGPGTRVLELPGSPFGGHRWGNTVDPVLPGLMDRPHVAREVLPLGSVGSVLLVDALDRRLQEGWLDVDAVAPVARLLGAGTVVLRSDLQYERFLTPRPDLMWDLLTGTDAPGLRPPEGHGERVANVAIPQLPMVDPLALRQRPREEHPPHVATFDVEGAVPIIRVAPTERPVLLAGDGDGIVDAAAAGIVDGRSLLLQVAALDDEELRDALDAGAELVLTDTNRRRIQTWFYAIRDTRGPTERAGETLHEPTGYDHRLDPFPGRGDDSRTVVEQVGGTVHATSGGGASRPEDRAVAAVDGDLATSWRVGGADPTGHRLVIEPDEAARGDHVVLVQPQDGPRDRVVSHARVVVNGEPIDVELGPESLQPEGQVVRFPPQEVERLEVELTGTSTPPFDPARANAVGFAEVRLGELRVREVVRPPLDLLARTDGGAGHRLDVVLTRLRYEPGEPGRLDAELDLARVLDLPRARSFGVSGTLRVNPDAPDAVLDEVLGTTIGGAVAGASDHLDGDLRSRASRAFDGDDGTWWQSPFGPSEGRWVGLTLPAAQPVGEVTVTLVDDDRHSLPASLSLVADGEVVASIDVPEAPVGERGATRSVTFPAVASPARELRVVVDAVRARTAIPGDPNPAAVLPVAVAEVGGPEVPSAVDPEHVPTTCRPLLRVGEAVVEVRAVGPVSEARRGLDLVPCGEPELRLEAGRHEIRSAPGLDTGLDVDQVVLSSDASGAGSAPGPRGARREAAGAVVEGVADGRSTDTVQLRSDGAPFWLVLGQSANEGWELELDGASAGPRRVVDGYANGWLVTPDGAGEITATLRWAPQRLIWAALAASLLAVGACVALVARRRPLEVATTSSPERTAPTWAVPISAALATLRRRGWAAPDGPGSSPGARSAPNPARLLGVAAGAAVLAWLVATPLAALVAAAVVVVGSLVPASRIAWLAAAPTAVAVAEVLDRPRLAWLALAVVGGDQLVRWLRRDHA